MPDTSGRTRYFTTKADPGLKLGPGEQLHFQTGRGYYVGPRTTPLPPSGGGNAAALAALHARSVGMNAKFKLPPRAAAVPPAGPRVAPPVDPYAARTQAQIDAEAAKQAQNAIDPQIAAEQHLADLAAARAKADELAIQGFTGAAAAIMAQIGPQIAAAYQGGAAEVGDLAKGVSGAVGDRLAAAEGANQDFAKTQGAEYTPGTDPHQLADTAYMLNGYVPGASLAEQGAAAGRWGAVLPAIQVLQGEQDFTKRMSDSTTEQDAYAQKLRDIAAQFPQLRDEALQKLQQYEIDKANYRETRRVNSANIANSAADNARQERALRDQEKAAGITSSLKAAELQYKYAALDFKSKQDKAKAKAAIDKATKAGQKIDAPGSKVLGYVIDQNGDPVLDSNGKRIPVAKTTSKTNTKGLTPYQVAEQKRNMYADAQNLRGDPITAPTGSPGKFIARQGAQGVFPGKFGGPATTNDPNKARRDGSMSFVQAVDYIVGAYGVTRAQARAALIANGWKPDGKRPNKGASNPYTDPTRGKVG